MRLEIAANGYTLKLSKNDVENWATKPGAAWPCSTLRGRRIVVGVDRNGLCEPELHPQREEVDGHELEAIVSDFTKGTKAAAFWPRWEREEVPDER